MRHWIGVMCVGAAFAIAGLLTRPDDPDALTTRDVWAAVSNGLLTLGGLIALIGLVGVASNLMKTSDRQQQP